VNVTQKVFFGFIILILLLSCRTETESESEIYQAPVEKNDGWEVSNLNQEGMDQDIIHRFLENIFDNLYKNIHSCVIARNGKLVLDYQFKTQLTQVDAYVGNTDLELHAMMSVTKSLVSVLVGIAIDQGFISGVSQNVYPFFPEYQPFENWCIHKSKVTVKDFLIMCHGYDWDEISFPYTDPRNSYYQMSQRNDWVRYVLDLKMIDIPGQVFNYSSGVSHVMGKLISNASGLTLEDFTEFYLLVPLGIDKIKWIKAPNGMADDAYLTTRDMAKLGQLVLNQGTWDNQRIVSDSWIDGSTRQYVDVGDSFGYAYFWWTYVFRIDDRDIESLMAWGYGGQFIFVFRSLNLVVCFTGGNYGNGLESQPFEMVRLYILPSILRKSDS
jgi:CubicO group peptidase (beta-lactamase class C family)